MTAPADQTWHPYPHSYDEPDGDSSAYRPQVAPADAYEAPDAPLPGPEPAAGPPPVRGRGKTSKARSRRRKKSGRPGWLRVAAPSAVVMGLSALAGTQVSRESESAAPAVTALSGTAEQEPVDSDLLDDRLAGLSEGADDFADRASRTQARLDLAQAEKEKRQKAEAAREKAAEEARRREALRPKFASPIAGSVGISAYFGQAGSWWTSTHTGIDFPVSMGTPVRAMADGTVSTRWNSSYGNMLILTTADGTELWYCHLNSYQLTTGSVQAGDVVAYSGNSGNSTGPHLHVEVRPGGGSSIDPLAWLRAKGVDL